MTAQFIQATSNVTLPWGSLAWHAPDQGLLDLDFWPTFHPNMILQKTFSLWRYRAVFPPLAIAPVSFGEGLTPLVDIDLDGHQVPFKLDYLFPSGSYKDRGSTVLMTYAKSIGAKTVVQDSSGNAGASIAHYAAAAQLPCTIFVPDSTSPAKLTQIQAVGANLVLVPGSREDTAIAARAAAQDAFYASHVWHPVFYEGTKTFAYEVFEQSGFSVPDTVILPAGNGTLLLGCYKGFEELKRSGLIKQVPKLIAIQAAHCAPLYHQFHQQGSPDFWTSTLAEGIAIAQPLRGPQMLAVVRQTGGTYLEVAEDEIIDSFRFMSKIGQYIEPTSAAVVAGVRQYVKSHALPSERIISVLTGSGLKTGQKIQKMR